MDNLDERDNVKKLESNEEKSNQLLEASPSSTAQGALDRAVSSFQEHVYEDLTEIKTKIAGLESKINIIDENGVKTIDLLSLAGSLEGLSDRLGGVSDQVALVDRDAAVRAKELRDSISETEDAVKDLRHEFENEVQLVESKMRITVEEYHSRGQQTIVGLRAELSNESERNRIQIGREFEVLKNDVDSKFFDFSKEWQSSMNIFSESTRKERAEVDRKVNEVIYFLKAQKPVASAEQNEFQTRIQEQVRVSIAESAERQRRSLEEFKQNLDINRRWAIGTAIAAVASLTAVIALILSSPGT